MACCKKVYVLPKFVLPITVFTGTMIGNPGPLRITTDGQLVLPDNDHFYDNTLPVNLCVPMPMKLLLPKLTDIRCPKQGMAQFSDWVMVPAGSGRWYMVIDFDDKWKGFATEHRVCWIRFIQGLNVWPFPTP